MKGEKSQSGQITVFLSIILLAFVVLVCVVVDGSRIITGKTHVTRAVESALKSALADYSSVLKNQYGIFALNVKDENILGKTVNSYIQKNLNIKDNGQKDLDLYDFRIEEINVTPFFNLTENEVVRNQIIEYMKYRAPWRLAENFLEKMDIVKESGVMAEAYKKRTAVDKLFGRMDKKQQQLKQNIDGMEQASVISVNSFNKDNVREKLVDWIAQLFIDKIAFQNDLMKLDKKILDLEKEIDNIPELKKEMSSILDQEESESPEELESPDEDTNESDQEQISKEELEQQLEDIKSQKETASDTIKEIKAKIDGVFKQMRYDHTQVYLKVNVEAEKNIKELVDIGEQVNQAILALENYLRRSLTSESELLQDFISVCMSDVIKLKDLMLVGKRAEDMISNVKRNIQVIQNVLDSIDKVENMLETQADILISKAQISEMLQEGLDKYNNMIDYQYYRPEKSGVKDDPRKGKEAEVEEQFKKPKQEDVDLRKIGINVEQLPSRNKVSSDDFSEQDDGAAYNGSLQNIDQDVDLYDDEGEFSDNAFGFISSIGSLLKNNFSALRDEIYINEYIMETFKSSVSRQQYISGNYRRDGKGMDTVFNSEVEYILHGNYSENINKTMTEAQILLIRFGLDALHVYMDTAKKETATGIAAAITGWWTGGAGIPIISNLIMCGWGMGEAIIDLSDLKKGRSVPFYKSKGDWKLDTGLFVSSDIKTEPEFSFSYQDYLRLLLLLVNSENKISRIEDIIQLNIGKQKSGFEMSDCKTYVRVEAVVSMKYFFMTQAFMPGDVKTPEGRHKFKVIVFEGY